MSMTQQQLAEHAQVGIATIKRIEKGGGLNLDTLISLLRALDKLHNLDAILFESEMRNFNESYEIISGKLKIRQQPTDLNKKNGVLHADENSFSMIMKNSLSW